MSVRLLLLLVCLRPSSASAPGHVFILHTDIRYLACDAWLLPVGRSMHVDKQWGLHKYTDVYASLFHNMRNDRVNLTEVGIQ